jgi:hypothetical protein
LVPRREGAGVWVLLCVAVGLWGCGVVGVWGCVGGGGWGWLGVAGGGWWGSVGPGRPAGSPTGCPRA